MSDHPEMPRHCWDSHPACGIRCLKEPHHLGDHYNWFTGRRWPDRAAPAQELT